MDLEIVAIKTPTVIQEKYIQNGTILHSVWIYTHTTYGCKLK